MQGQLLRWATSIPMIVVLLAFSGIEAAHAQTQAQTRDFNVPEQSATTGIPEFARQAGIQILVSETLVHGKRITTVTGSHPVAEALTILLKETGLTATSKDGVTYTVAASAPPTTSTGTVHFNIPAEDLAQALADFGAQSGLAAAVETTLTAGKKSAAVRGDLAPTEALGRLLKGSGLTFTSGADGTIAIEQITAGGPVQASAGDSDLNKDLTQRDQLEPIEVTGSHIRGIDNKTSSVIVIDQAQIQQSGYSSTQDLFRSLPQNFSSGDANEDGVFTGNVASIRNTDYASGVDLRGLGASSTLVLLNGHRLAPSASGTFVDVSQIPLAAIDRVEILTDGSSAIYGSDAVGGVVNIILKRDYRGADTSARYGATSDGGRDEVLAAQTVGSSWSGGNAVGTLQFQRQDSLPARDRDFASTLPEPNDLVPERRGYSATLDGRQTLSDRFELYGDVLLSRRSFTIASSESYAGYGLDSTHTDGDTSSIDVSPGLRFILSPQWSIDLNGLFGYQKSTGHSTEGFPQAITDVANDNRFTEKSVDLIVNGRVRATPAGDIGIAVGASYRTENLNTVTIDSPGGAFPTVEDRHVTAGFAEFHLPIIGEANRVPLIEALELSAALRRDEYSDFGSTTNPHFGLRWAPWTDMSLRASYGRSFRAPSVLEESQEAIADQSIYIYQVASPTGPGVVPALIEYGSKSLTAERARTFNFGVEYKPSNIQGLSAALDYYDILYINRIIIPPIPFNFLQQPGIYGPLISPVASDAAAQAIVNAAEAAGVIFSDFYGNGVAGVRYLYDDRQQNAAVVRQSGVDLTSRFIKEIGAHTLSSQVSISFIGKIDTQFAPGAFPANQVNTIGNPAKWRARFASTWADKAWSLSGAVNAIGGYVNTSAPGTPPISSWITVDVNATFNADAYFQSVGWRGISLSFIALNIANRDPPFVVNPTALTNPVNYDPSNANPLGRFVALQLRKKW